MTVGQAQAAKYEKDAITLLARANQQGCFRSAENRERLPP
jgi:hypothetical protein